jgi:hypothetical protein
MALKLSAISLDTKSVTIDVPGFPGFKVELAYCSRTVAAKLREKATTNKFTRGQMVAEFDEKLFNKLFTEATVRGWEGLQLGYINEMMLVNLSDVEDWTQEQPYSPEDAVTLVTQSVFFDNWLTQAAFDLSTFRSERESKAAE